MALGVGVNWSFLRAAGIGCHTGQEDAALPLTEQGDGRAGSKAMGRREGGDLKDFMVRSQPGNHWRWEKSFRAGWREQHGVRSQGGHSHREGSGSGQGSHLSPALGALARHLLPRHRALEFQRSEASAGVGLGAGVGAQGLSRRRVPGHLSHRKGSRRRVKVAVKV